MISSSIAIFLNVFEGVFFLFIIMVASGLLVKKNIISQSNIESLSHVIIVVLLPCLMVSKIILNFNPQQYLFWWILPLVAIIMISFGILLGKLFYFRKYNQNKNLIAVASFMNANYMVLPIGKMIFKDNFDEFATLCFLFILGVNPYLWSVGKKMVTSADNKKLNIKGLLTPPLVATVSSILIVLTGLSNFIPYKVIKPIEFMGEAAIPMATFVLGATLGSVSIKKMPALIDLLKINGIKLIIIPLVTILVLKYTGFFSDYDLIRDLFVIQASVAPATQLIIQIRKYGGDVHKIGNVMLSTYTLCLITIPFWYTFWQQIK